MNFVFYFEFIYIDCKRAADGTFYSLYRPLNSNLAESVTIDYPTRNVIHVPRRYHEKYRQWVTYDEIPANIKHKFGAYQTQELLKDNIKVHNTLSRIYNAGNETYFAFYKVSCIVF